MIKVFFGLVAIHSVLCAPVSPFLKYGVPSEKSEPFMKKVEKLLPGNTENLYQGSEINAENIGLPLSELPGTRNLDEKSIPDSVTRNLNGDTESLKNLPGIRNLDEKSIPDSITLKRIPEIVQDFELPRQQQGYQYFAPAPDNEEKIIIHQELIPPQKNEQGFQLYYPNPENSKIHEESEIKETQLLPSSNAPQNSLLQPQQPVKPIDNSNDKNQINIQPGSSIKIQDNLNQYSHGFSNPDGTQIQESGHLISTDDGWEYVIAKEGSYRYISPEGYPISVRYIADENGFRILSQSFFGR